MKRLFTFVVCFLLLTASNQKTVLGLDMEDIEDKLSFHISGFMDIEYWDLNYESKNNLLKHLIGGNGAFMQSHFNVYFSFFAGNYWKAFGEIRYLYIPDGRIFSLEMFSDAQDSNGDGIPDAITIRPVNTTTIDKTFSSYKYGSIFIERAYIEWTRLTYANIRAGRFFTPFGIWSQDHGAPAITSVRFPLITNPPLSFLGIPSKQTGLELLGNVPFVDFLVEYAFYIGNGMSNSEALADDYDKNKSFGGFLNLRFPTISDMIDVELGASGYRGKRTFLTERRIDVGIDIAISNGSPVFGFTMTSDPANDRFIEKQWETCALAHLKISIGSLPFDGIFILQSEGSRLWVDPDRDYRVSGILGGVSLMGSKKYYIESCYIQAEYQFFGVLAPYLRYEWMNLNTNEGLLLSFFKSGTIYLGGLNYKPIPRICIKAEYLIFDIETPLHTNNDLNIYAASASMAF